MQSYMYSQTESNQISVNRLKSFQIELHSGAFTSRAKKILLYVATRFDDGATIHEIADQFKVGLNNITEPISSYKRKGYLVATTSRYNQDTRKYNTVYNVSIEGFKYIAKLKRVKACAER